MYISDKAFDNIKQIVGFRSRPYKDSLGNIIVGHNHVVVTGDGVAQKDIINAVKANELLTIDVKKIINNLNITKSMTQEKFDALITKEFLTTSTLGKQ